MFQNAGLQIIEPRITLQFKTDKEVYQPGEKVTLDVTAQLEGKPVSTMVALGVVDEMIYVLQPEIAPDIGDFFYHPRRNNVRTTASLSFISYDLAAGRTAGAPARSNYNERAVKVLERPRRDNTDTALWIPSVKTDADGRARVTFTMPDSLTRWRITGRAMDAQGRVGQRSGYLRSDKAYYAKWTAPNWLRAGDTPQASVAVFNQTAGEQELEVALTGGGVVKTEKIKARRGVNYVHFAVPAGGGAMRLEIRQGGKVVDALDTSVQAVPQQWTSTRSVNVPLTGPVAPLALPADARNVRVFLAQGSAGHFARIADDLIDFPYGGVENTASRLIPLSLAAQSVGPEPAAMRDRLMARLQSERLRLVSMAGPDAQFGWWGNATEGSSFMTAYAYYADWHAARTLRIELPVEHWENLLTVYSKLGVKEPLLQRALTLWMANEMGLPVKTLASGLADDVAKANNLAGKPVLFVRTDSAIMGSEDATTRALTAVLLSTVSNATGLEQSPAMQGQNAAAAALLTSHQSPFVQSLLMLGGHVPVSAAENVLAAVSADMPSIDRALALVWVQKKLGGPPPPKAVPAALAGTWYKNTSPSGLASWIWQGPAVPAQLQLSEAAPAGSVAVVQYDSRAPETHKLAVRVERRILLLTPDKVGFEATPVKGGEALRTDALYMDEVTLTPAANARHRYGVLEVALPPGGSVEAGTWGIKIDGEKDAFERARHDARREGYVVAVEPLAGPVKIRHLLRFAQKGTYTLPPARFYRMYQPEQKAFEGEGKTMRTLQVQ